MIFTGGVCCAVVLLAVGLASAGWRRRRDVSLVLSGLGVLLMPVAHFVLAFFGFVLNPRHYVGDYWAMQRDSRVEALVVSLTLAVLVAGAGLVGATSRPRSGWRLGIGAIEVVAGVVFAVVELNVGLPALADAASRVGTIPM